MAAASKETPAPAEEAASSITSVKSTVAVAESVVEEAVGFYKAVFGAEVVKVNRTADPNWKPGRELPRILSAEIDIGSQLILVSGEIQDAPANMKVPFVLEVDGEYFQLTAERAAERGAVHEGALRELECGRLSVKLRDPFGVLWILVSSRPPSPPPPQQDAESQCSAAPQQDAESECSSVTGRQD